MANAAWGRGMSRRTLQRVAGRWETRVRQYLAFRNGLGASLSRQGEELLSFARHLDSAGEPGPLTNDLTLAWVTSSSAGRRYWTTRLTAVRGFAKYLVVTDPRHEVPPRDLMVARYVRRAPHIYSPAEIEALMDAPYAHMARTRLCPLTYRTVIGLLAVTGMRGGEALGLCREDVDLLRGRITIRNSKFGKSRVLPLHPSTLKALRTYVKKRDAVFPTERTDAFFVSQRGTPLSYTRFIKTFEEFRHQLGWRQHPRPRPHDLRHTFAVTHLLRWCRAGVDVDTKILALTTYLGHVDLTSTYWYFTAVPELLALAGSRFQDVATLEGS